MTFKPPNSNEFHTAAHIGGQFRRGLVDNGYLELAMSSLHAVAIDLLPAVHRDPLDRMLVAQASVEGFPLITSDAVLAQYSGLVRRV